MIIKKGLSMLQYIELLDKVMRDGTVRDDRTGTGTKGIFGYQMRFNLEEVFHCSLQRSFTSNPLSTNCFGS
jgi:thymidylate synthase